MKNVELAPVKGEDVVIHVPKGAAKHVKVVESEAASKVNDITVHVSRERKVSPGLSIGVIVK